MMTNIEDVIKRVLKGSHCATLKEIHSYFSGSYMDMCRIADALYYRGCDFLYDPRRLNIVAEDLDNSMWYRISAGTRTIAEGFEMKSGEMSEDEMINLLKDKWQDLDKPEPSGYYQVSMCEYMRYPRDIHLNESDIAAFDLKVLGHPECITPVYKNDANGDNIVEADISGRYITYFNIISPYPEKVRRDGVTYVQKRSGIYECDGRRISLSLNEAEKLAI